MCANFPTNQTTLIFFSTNFSKNGFRFTNSKNQHRSDTMYANSQAKRTALNCLAQICPKMDLGLEIQKTNVGIKISILEIPCVPILWKNRQL